METVGHNGQAVKPEIGRQTPLESTPGYWSAVPSGYPLPDEARFGQGVAVNLAPSLSVCHNCIVEVKPQVQLPGSARKMAEVVRLEVERLARNYGLERLGFLTLSFVDAVYSIREAQRRYHSLLTNFLSANFGGGIVVWERFNHGIHFHLLVVCDEDIKTGFDFEAVKRRDYRSVCPWLRAMWATLRVVLPEYGRPEIGEPGFGRHELLPIRTEAEAVGRYLGKYISKHLECKLDIDRGAKIVRFFGCARVGRVASAQFAWANGRSYIWRLGVGAFAEHFRVTWSDLSRIGGARWAFHLGRAIFDRGLREFVKGGGAIECKIPLAEIGGVACPSG